MACFVTAVHTLAMSPYGDFDAVVATLEDQLRNSVYLLGDSPSAADILWGSALNWTIAFGLVPNTDVFRAYVERIANRPAALKVAQRDAELAAEHERDAAAMDQSKR